MTTIEILQGIKGWITTKLSKVVSVTAQTFTDAEKKQARTNLGFGNGDIDDEPAAGSDNLVKSGGVYEALSNIDVDVETTIKSRDSYNLDIEYVSGSSGVTKDFWLNAGDYISFKYTGFYQKIFQHKKSDGTYYGYLKCGEVRTPTVQNFRVQISGYYRFNVINVTDVVVTPAYYADKLVDVAFATKDIDNRLCFIEQGNCRYEWYYLNMFELGENGKCWNTSTNEVSDSKHSSDIWAIIDVEGVSAIHFMCVSWGGAARCPTFFNTKNPEDFSDETMVGYIDSKGRKSIELYSKVPQNAKSICFCVKNDVVPSRKEFFIKYYTKNPEIKVNKSWASIGDSITKIDDDKWETYNWSLSRVKGYQGYLQERLQVTNHINLGISGSNSLTYDVETISNADIYTIALGINDWGAGNALGTLEDYKTWQSEAEVNNFAKGISRIVHKIREINSKAEIVIMTPTRGKGAGYFPSSVNGASLNGNHTYLHEYADLLIEIAHYEGFPVADIYHLCGFNDNNLSAYTVDGIHPKDSGCKRIANILFPVMRYFSDEYNTKPASEITS